MIINRLEFIQRVQINSQTLDLWLEEDWLIPNAILADIEFSDIDLARARLILDLKDRLGVNDESVGMILNLVDQVHGLRSLVAELLPKSSGGPRPAPGETLLEIV